MIFKTSFGTFKGNEEKYCYAFLGIPFASARRFEYGTLIDSYKGETDATKFGPACIQKRVWFEHLEVPERMFYHREFRDNIRFDYSEDCLNLNIYTPKKNGRHPVIVFIHGGGFDSGANSESAFDGDALAFRDIVTVFIQYRVGPFGYFTHEDIQKQYGHNGNFGLSDQILALEWVKKHIGEFGGDSSNITVMGQSAGAISIQDLIFSSKAQGLFQKAIMMSGGGKFPFLGAPRPAAKTNEYWLAVMEKAGCKTLEEFKEIPPKKIFEALEEVRKERKDSLVCTMPCYDHYYLEKPYKEMFKEKVKLPTIIGFTNNDMLTIVLARMAIKYANKNNCYLYYFDVDAKGDDNKAFHSSDLRYAFGTLDRSWRPYDAKDRTISTLMMDYFASFARTSNPNSPGLPHWERKKNMALSFNPDKVKMVRPPKSVLLRNTFKGDPK